ncbi:MAG: hypothetical protein N2689_17870, partial [Verrucomicrobiae bacterium]|nr:hypothetical protein [Verrucomicrobiae bacterium]
MKTDRNPKPPVPWKKIFIGPDATDHDIKAAAMELNLVNVAKALAEKAHKGKFGNDGKTPHIVHARRMVGWLLKSGASDRVIAAAWLHDILGRGRLTEAELKRAGVPSPVIEAVVALSKRPGESYYDYLARVEANPIARRVKIADMIDNVVDEPSPQARRRYQHGLACLLSDTIAAL